MTAIKKMKIQTFSTKKIIWACHHQAKGLTFADPYLAPLLAAVRLSIPPRRIVPIPHANPKSTLNLLEYHFHKKTVPNTLMQIMIKNMSNCQFERSREPQQHLDCATYDVLI